MPNKYPEYSEYFDFLDWLRDSGVTNMFGAVSYLVKRFDYLAEDEAKIILLAWMETFSERHNVDKYK